MDRLAQVCGERIAQIADSQPGIWVLDADLADSDGAEVFGRRHHERFLNVGIAEQAMVSVAAGLAACGCRPWVFSFAAFLCCRAYDQIRACISQTRLPVVLIGSHSGGLSSKNGKSHTVLNDIALMATLPHVEVWAPADRTDAVFCIDQIYAAQRAAYIRLPRDPVPPLGGIVSPTRWLGRPSPTALISHGLSSHWAVAAATLLQQRGFPISVVHFCRLWPLQSDLIRELLSGVELAFVLEDHYGLGGLASLLQSLDLPLRITSLAWPADWSGQSGKPSEVLKRFQLDPTAIADRISAAIPPVRVSAPPELSSVSTAGFG